MLKMNIVGIHSKTNVYPFQRLLHEYPLLLFVCVDVTGPDTVGALAQRHPGSSKLQRRLGRLGILP